MIHFMMKMAYVALVRYWNAALAALSLLGVIAANVFESLKDYEKPFLFLCANAIVWTLVEIKAEIRPRSQTLSSIHKNMRLARPHIVAQIEHAVQDTSIQHPLLIKMLGGRLRSMSDIVREVADDLRTGRISGHLRIEIFALAPEYIQTRVLPGDATVERQSQRNHSYADLIRSITSELASLEVDQGERSSIRIVAREYSHDPFIYAYLIGDGTLFWGGFTYSSDTCDFIGPENSCYEIHRRAPSFTPTHTWIASRLDLLRRESTALTPTPPSTTQGAEAQPVPGKATNVP
jgi:hypothetical protein